MTRITYRTLTVCLRSLFCLKSTKRTLGYNDLLIFLARKEVESISILLAGFDREAVDLGKLKPFKYTAYLSLIVPYKILWQTLRTILSAGTAVVEESRGRGLVVGLDTSIILDLLILEVVLVFTRRPFTSLQVVKIR